MVALEEKPSYPQLHALVPAAAIPLVGLHSGGRVSGETSSVGEGGDLPSEEGIHTALHARKVVSDVATDAALARAHCEEGDYEPHGHGV